MKLLDEKIEVRMDWFLCALAVMLGTNTWLPDDIRAPLVLLALVLCTRAIWSDCRGRK